MDSTKYEQRLRKYKQQKYKLLVARQDLEASPLSSLKKREIAKTIDETVALVDMAINSASRIVEYSHGIESEMKSYQIIEKKLQDVMFDNNLTDASTVLTSRKLTDVAIHLKHLNQLVKYKK